MSWDERTPKATGQTFPYWLQGAAVGGVFGLIFFQSIFAALIGTAAGLLIVSIAQATGFGRIVAPRLHSWWRGWPYWVRGGVIALVITVLSAVLTTVCEKMLFRPGYDGFGLECFPIPIPWWSLTLLLIVFGFDQFLEMSYPVFLLVGGIAWFVVGALVGGVIGFVKRKSKSPSV